ncbi:hypothetical protein C7S16_1690 [Burkholderia thailandensis]|uniref:Uncharacterized protein n=1 Tax=Burkholderia thailandensis TaxID=57975 RepID=A0AAW9D1P6_BURTH|nr:hypothetical protein [Burkholderia thailandensis]MDW9255856.1 hypothetical protein [Burkholderia thailandensis]
MRVRRPTMGRVGNCNNDGGLGAAFFIGVRGRRGDEPHGPARGGA